MACLYAQASIVDLILRLSLGQFWTRAPEPRPRGRAAERDVRHSSSSNRHDVLRMRSRYAEGRGREVSSEELCLWTHKKAGFADWRDTLLSRP